jgi:N-acetylmuramoyl-L-alanine amidase
VIEKPEEKSYEVSLEDLYMEKSIRLSIQNLREKNFTRGSLLTGSENESTIERVRLTYEYEPASFLYTCIFEVELDSVYAYQLYEDDTAIYVELWEPSKLYDKVIVVDAGHGGNDIGTYSLDMQYYEKDINLNITKDLKALLDKEDIKVYYTRLSDEKVYLNPRVDLANEIRADFFISIHANSGETTKAKGCEVLYGTTEESDTSFNSKKLASLCLKAMTSGRELANRGIVENNEIYIIGKSKVPIALIEVGFMTNEEDLEYIVDRSNQKKMAEYIYNGIMAAFSELKKQ